MSLDWNVTKVRDHEKLHEDAVQWGITEAIIWGCLAVDLPGIPKPKDADEYLARIDAWQRLIGPFLHIGGKPYYFTPEDIYRRTGLTTNVSRKPRTTFGRKLIDAHADAIEAKQRRETREAEYAKRQAEKEAA